MGVYVPFVLAYLAVWLLFLLVMLSLGHPWPPGIGGVDLVLLCLATFRLTELVSEEKVMRVLRAPFCRRVATTRADGTTVEEEVPVEVGWRRTIGELILCPWCAGIWVATLLTYFWILLPGVARTVLIAFAVAAGALLVEILVKLLDRTRQALPPE